MQYAYLKDKMMFTVTQNNSFKRALITMVALLASASASATAMTIQGKAKVLDYKESKGQPKQCMELPAQLDAKQQYYGDFIHLTGAKIGAASHYVKQPVALTTGSDLLCFNELRYGYRYRVTFRDGFPLADGHTFRHEKSTALYTFAIPDLDPSIKFQGNSLVLPTIGGPKVPLVLTNTGEFSLKVFRLSEIQIQASRGLKGLRLLDQSDINNLEENAHVAAEQAFSVQVEQNKPTTFNLDLADLVDTKKAGIYVLVVESDDIEIRYWDDRPTQYVMFTDVGLSTYRGIDGLRVYARSYATADPLVGTQIDLIAKNQEVLQTLTTNTQGYVQFSLPMINGYGGLKPVEVRARSKDGLGSYLDLTGKQMDLADRPVSGADPLGLFNAYLFTERGVYRPGEDVVLSGLVRNKELVAPMNVPLTLKIINAQGKEQISRLIGHLEQGGLQYRFTIPSTSKTGQWSAKLYLSTDDDPIGSVDFSVEDYVPETLAVELTTKQLGYTNDAMDITLQSDFLYGAPATDLAVSASVSLVPQRRVFSDWSQYVFGHYGEKATQKTIKVNNTDDSGQAVLTLPANLLKQANPNQARIVKITAGVTEPSGREVRTRLTLPVLNYDSWVGVRVKNERNGFDRNEDIAFNLININSDTSTVKQGQVSYKIIEEDWDYHWYYSNRWRYTINRYDKGTVTNGNLTTNDEGITRIEVGQQPWGRYRLEVTDLNSGQSTQLRYRVGWWNAAGSQSALPDQVKMALSQTKATAGEQVTLHIKPPYAGKLHLLIANETILEERVLDIPAEGMEVSIDVEKSFGPDVYLMANVYRPGHQGAGPARAVGISHLTIKQPRLYADVQVIAPAKVEPNQSINVEVQTNLPKGSRVILAAVDEGILQLTRFESPDPQAFFLAKRRLGLRIMDLYGHLIQHQDGESLRVHFGGDADSAGGSDVAPLSTFVKPVALVSDLAPVDDQGNVTIALDLPQYNGRLRLMAVAFNDQRMGSASDNMIVRDPVVVQPVMPRFMSVGDQAQVSVSLHNLELPNGKFTLDWDATDNFELSEHHQTIELAVDQRTNLGINIQAISAQAGRVGLTLTRPDGVKQYYHWDLTAITNRFVEEYESSVFLAAGSRGTIGSDVGDLTPASRQIKVRVTDRPVLATDWISQSLSRYPFGCLEQTTSRAWPVLYLSDNDPAWSTKARNKHITKAINHISQMQLNSGAFSLWRGGHRPQPWLSMYAMEFLQEAKAKGYDVPEAMLTNGMDYVENINVDTMSVMAYAMYIRAKYGNPDAGEARYLASKLASKAYGVQSHVHLSATFGLLGDTQREQSILSAIKGSNWTSWTRYDYRSRIRDKALMSYYALKSESIAPAFKAKVLEQLEGLYSEAKTLGYISTQEKGWLLRLASLNNKAKPLPQDLAISLDFRDFQLKDLANYLADQSAWTSAKNTSDNDMYIKISSSGVNKELTDAFANHMIVTTEYKNLATGKQMELSQVKQGTDVMVVHKIEIDHDLKYDMELSIEAPVPAGFELENPRLSSGRTLITKVKRLTPSFEEYRDDRYVAAWSLSRGYRSRGIKDNALFVAYVMRAVTPGSYLVPAVSIEDMYQPRYRANTAESHVVVTQD